jgi:PAS domain S-box-containing protein
LDSGREREVTQVTAARLVRGFVSLLALAVQGQAHSGPATLATPGEASVEGSRVVVLHSYHHGFTWSDSISEGIRSVFAEEGGGAELKFEFLDARFRSNRAYLRAVRDTLMAKYADRSVDAVIASDDHALNFMLDHGREVFHDAPVVFCSVSGFSPEMREQLELTGLRESIDIRSTVETALRLHPDTKNLAVILDLSRTGRALREKTEQALEGIAGDIQVRYFENSTVEQLQKELPALPDDTVVLLFIFPPDATGRVLSHERNLERVRPHCPHPIYSVWQFYLGHGIVGGRLVDGHEEGRMAASMALRILRGARAADIPPRMSPVRYMFDHDELERFGLKRALLPERSVVVNEPFSLYERYKLQIWGVVAAFVFLIGTVSALVVLVIARRKAEVRLRASEVRYRELVESLPEPLIEFDRESVLTYANRRALEVFGYRREDLASGVDALNLLAPEERERARDNNRRRVRGDDVGSVEYLARRKDGSSFPVLLHVTPITQGGELWGFRGVVMDITERKRAEEERARIEEQFQQSLKMESVGRLAGGVAHDLNNLLSPILGYGELLLEDLERKDGRRESVGQIVAAGTRARDLVRQLLAFSRKQTLDRKPVHLNDAVAGFEKLLRRTIREDIEIEVLLAPEVATVMGDIGQIEQVIMNLAVNSQDAMPAGGTLTIETALAEFQEPHAAAFPDIRPGEYAVLAVTDTGCGMDAETRQHLFEPFYSTKGEHGTGLGMATVYGIVRQHDGAIWVHSEPNEGTTVEIYLPVAKDDPRRHGPASAPPVGLTGTETILIVEDDDQVRALGRHILERQGYKVLTECSGREALEHLRVHGARVDLLLTDVVMPEMNGKELYVRALEVRPGLRVLYMSGYNDDVIAHSGAREEGIAFIQKPFTVLDLATKVREVLDEE